MWFRNLRLREHSHAWSGVTALSRRRRARKFGLRAVEGLEDRALLSHGASGHLAAAVVTTPTTFVQTNLVSDQASVMAKTTDPDLVNAWGIAHLPTTPWWVSDNNAGVSTIYNGNTGAKASLTVTIPSPTAASGGTPTGIVANTNSTEFNVNGASAHFIFATEDGTIAAWTGGTTAVIKADNSTNPSAKKGAVYKGLALASNNGADYLYATNFRAGTIDVFDSSFNQVTLGSGAFTGTFRDNHVPQSFAPFGIANIGGDLFVTYAKQNSAKHDDVAGPGRGFIDEFDPAGNLIQRVATKGTLNSPWGLAVAPKTFGTFAGDLLVGNFGDGHINAFTFPTAQSPGFQFAGQLSDAGGNPIAIDGLWGLGVGNDGLAGPSTTLFFSAGPDGETHGLFGTLTPST
jgi:uncharacterized protein (TIGR03118 family)